MARKKPDTMQVSQDQTPVPPPPTRKPGIKVNMKIYIISLIIVALAVFLLMLFQYFPGYRVYRDIEDGVKNAKSVTMEITTTRKELENRKINPLTKEKDIKKRFEDMGAKDVTVEIKY